MSAEDVEQAVAALSGAALDLKADGWQPSIVVYAPGELQIGGRTNEGYAVALVLPLPTKELATA